MNFFCRIFGHTWVPRTSTPDPRWNTTKDGQVLVPTIPADAIRYYEACQRCGAERDVSLPKVAARERAATGEASAAS